MGATAEAAYKRIAILGPRAILAQIDPWDVETINEAADAAEKLLASLPKPPGVADLQPAGDPWQESWLRGDPLREGSAAVLARLAQRSDAPSVAAFAAELRGQHYE